MFTEAAIQIAIIGIVIGIVSALINRKLVDPKKQKEAQKMVSEAQKKLMEAKKANNQSEINKAQTEYSQAMKAMKDSMMQNFKPMMITFVPFLIILGFLGSTYSKVDVFPGAKALDVPVVGGFFSGQGWLAWYILIAFITGIAMNIIFKIKDKKKK